MGSRDAHRPAPAGLLTGKIHDADSSLLFVESLLLHSAQGADGKDGRTCQGVNNYTPLKNAGEDGVAATWKSPCLEYRALGSIPCTAIEAAGGGGGVPVVGWEWCVCVWGVFQVY